MSNDLISGSAPGGGGGVSAPSLSTAGQGYFYGGYDVGNTPLAVGGADINSPLNSVRVYQFVLSAQVTVRKITINVIAASAATNWFVGIYDASGNKLIDSGAFSSATTGVKTNTLGAPVTLNPGVYYLASSADSITPTVQTVNQLATSAGVFNNAVVVRIGTAANSLSGGVLPATLGALTGGFSHNVAMAFFEP